MTLQKGHSTWLHDPAKLRSAPPAGGRISLQMRWLHDPAKISLQVAA
jgi:hypothetical protein